MRVLVYDDQRKVAMLLKRYIHTYYPMDSVVVVDTLWVSQRKEPLESFDVVFLVIDDLAQKQTLFDFGKRMREQDKEVKIIVVSKFPEIASESFEVHPYYFFLKPIDLNVLSKTLHELTIDTAERRTLLKYLRPQSSNRKMLIRTKDGILWLDYEHVFYLEKVNKEVLIHTIKAIYTIKQSLTELEELLPENFSRVHKSYIINLNHVNRITELGDRSYEIEFAHYDKSAMMSRYKAPEFFKRLGENNVIL